MSESIEISVVILAKNEEGVLARCLSQLDWADEVLVIDSGSTDATREEALKGGARIVDQPWLGWSAQRNRGAAAASHDWVFFMEADEVASHTLRSSIRHVLSSAPDPRDAFAVNRRDEFWGQLLPQSQRRRKQLDRVRLYHREHCSWDESMLVHEEVVVRGKKQLLSGILLHWRPESVAKNAERIARYSTIEARQMKGRDERPSIVRLLLLPVLRFAWLYLFRGCFRHGTAGLVCSVNRAYADFLRLASLVEGSLPPVAPHPPQSLVDS